MDDEQWTSMDYLSTYYLGEQNSVLKNTIHLQSRYNAFTI